MSGRWAQHDLDAPAVPGLEILSEIGRGAGSVVYRARKDVAEHAEYAVKVLIASPHELDRVLVRFRREAALLASVNDPRLPRIHEVGHVGARPYMVMDLAEGRPLSDLIRSGALSIPRALGLILDIVEPLALLHDQGLVHRDIKPQNVMVLSDGSARLIDFGLATRESDGGGAEPSVTVGTLAYAAPEQGGTLRRPVDNRSDLYGIGVLLFECVTGTLPFRSNDIGELLRMHATMPAPDVREVIATSSGTGPASGPGPRTMPGPGLAAVIATLLAKDPDDRYGSGHALAADLRHLIREPDAVIVPGVASVPRPDGVLCGRAVEAGRLAVCWEQARSGRGATTMLRGPEGIGLTRLTRHTAEHARNQGALVLVATCHEDDAVPLAPVRSAIEGLLREAEAWPEPERQALHTRMRTAAGTVAPLLASISPALQAVLGVGPLPDGDRHRQFAASMAGFITDLARLAGAMVVIADDVHLADPATLGVLTALAARIPQAPILSIGTARAGWEREDHTEQVLATRARLDLDLTVGPLDDAGITELVGSVLPGIDLGSHLAGLLTTRCQGNPFITLEYLRAIVDAGLLRPHWGSWILDTEGLSALALPQDALGLVLARLGGLDDEARRLLVVAAAIGTSFHPDVVAEVCAVDTDLTMSAMARAASLHLVDVREAGDYEFLHARIREGLLDGLGDSHRMELHQTIAEVLDRRYRSGAGYRAPPLPNLGSHVPVHSPAFALDPAADRDQVFAMAHHYLLGDPRRSAQRAHQVCVRAGQLAMLGHAPAQAVVFLEHAGRLLPGDPQLLYLLGTAYQRDATFSRAVACCTEALTIEEDRLRRARILLLLAEVERSRWNIAPAQAAIEQGLLELERPLPRSRLGWIVSVLGHAIAGLFVVLTGLRFGSAEGERRNRDALTVALHTAGAYVETVAMRPGRRLAHSILGLLALNRLGAGPDYTVGISALGFMLSVIGLPRAGRRLIAEAETSARELNDPQLVAVAQWERGICAYLLDADDGQLWEDVLHENGRWMDAGHVSDGVASIAWEAAVMGRVRDASDWYQLGRQLVDQRTKQEITSLITLGVVAATAQGRSIEAAAELRRITPLLEHHTGPGLRVNLVLAQIHSLAEQGELGEPFEAAASSFFALRLSTRMMIRQHRHFFVVLAFGRLAQCRALAGSVAGDQLAPALVRARQSVRQLQRCASTTALRAFAQVARAQLDVLEGHPETALRRLAKVRPWNREAPILSYELACTNARALAAAGFRPQAQDQARLAYLVAEEAGLVRRARWVLEEFGGAVLTGFASFPAEPTVGTPRDHPNGWNAGNWNGWNGWNGSNGSWNGTGMDRQRLQALQDISLAAARILDPDELARICLDRTLRILSAERAVLFLVDDDDETSEPLRPHISRDAHGRDVPELTGYSASLVERVRETREPIVITGTEQGAAMGAQSVVLHGLRSVLVAPLLLEGRLLGVVYLDSQVAKGIFTTEDAGILLALMTHIATSLETARAAQLQVSVRTAQQQRDLAESLRTALAEMSAALEPDDVLTRLLGCVQTVLPGTSAWLVPAGVPLLDDPGLQAVLAAASRSRPAVRCSRLLR